MLRIGLTGGISTGKSTVGEIIQHELGVPVIDADAASREVVLPGQPALEAIVAHFGPTVLQANGHLNRSVLGQIVMTDPKERKALEAITHPQILAHIARQLYSHEQAGASITVVEAALMVETGSYSAFDKVLVVSCSTALQRQRLMNRNGYSEAEARRWIDNQLPLSQKEAVADVVIHNNGDLKALRSEVRRAWKQLGL